jgi:hypothetical protein
MNMYGVTSYDYVYPTEVCRVEHGWGSERLNSLLTGVGPTWPDEGEPRPLRCVSNVLANERASIALASHFGCICFRAVWRQTAEKITAAGCTAKSQLSIALVLRFDPAIDSCDTAGVVAP